MEGVLELIREKYNVESVEETGDKTEVCCGRYTHRLDHFVCGDEDCRCDKAEGWCEDQWEEECVRPLVEEFEKWVSENIVFADQVKLYCEVSEKGYLYIHISQNPKRARKLEN